MQEVDLVLTALSAGAMAGLTNTATAAVTDLYQSVRGKVRVWLDHDSKIDEILEGYEHEPKKWESDLRHAIVESGALADRSLLEQARDLLTLADAPKNTSGKYIVHSGDVTNQQIGENNHMDATHLPKASREGGTSR